MTPGTRRLITACVFALLAAVPLAAITGAANPPQWGARIDRLHQEGDNVKILFIAKDPENKAVSYGSSSLPRGLTIDPLTGLVSGILTPSDRDTTNGSAGVHTVVIRATDADGEVADYTFTWRVSRFRKGDVFAGIGLGRYQVFGDDGTYKYTVTSETEEEWTNAGAGGGGTTTGCGYNWVSRKMYFTAFDVNHAPAVIEIDPVPASDVEAFPRKRISTFRDSGFTDPATPTLRLSIDNAPESVVFDGQGNMFVGHASGFYNGDWMPGDSAGRAIIAPSPTNPDDYNYYYVKANGSQILSNRLPIPFAQGVSVDGFLEKWPGMPWPVTGNAKPLDHWGRDVQKFLYSSGTGELTRAATFDVHAGYQGSDWLDLSSDQRTLFYTSEWGVIYRYDTGPGVADTARQLTPFVTLPPIGERSATLYAVRLLPPGDGSGGLIVATPYNVVRIASNGRIVSHFDAPGEDSWFAVTLSPDGRTMWSASMSSGRIYRWDISTAQLLAPVAGIETQALELAPDFRSLTGLCIMGEYTAAQEVCGNGLDDDGDGEIDEVCRSVEACIASSPGDDDGDGLVDSNDPDCGAESVCALDGYTDSSIAGFCSRLSSEGDAVQVGPAPGPPPESDQRETYQVSGLPPGIVVDANGWYVGTPLHSIVLNTANPDTVVYPVTVNVTRRQVSTGNLIATFQQNFNWTIKNRNQVPVAVADAVTMRPGQSRTIDVRLNDSDLDAEDTLSITGFTQPASGALTQSGTSFTYVPSTSPVFVGTDSWTYTIADGRGGTATATVTANVVNTPPIAVADVVSVVAGQAVTVNVLANDPPDADGDTRTITGFTQPSGGTVTQVAGGLRFTPVNGFAGVASFTYTIADGFGGVSTAPVTIRVVNIPPVAVADSATAAGTRPVIINVLANDNDPDNHVIAVSGALPPANGTAVVNANGTITYTANAGFQGSDSFLYTIRDGFGGESSATVTIAVGPPNRFDPCLCASARASIGEIWPANHKKVVDVKVTNVIDPDGGALAIKVLGIYQDEPTNYLGDGNTTIDGGGIGTDTAWVRAERTGNPNVGDNGRAYEIVFEASAPDGSSCQGSVFTGVPHDQGQGNYIFDDGIRYDSTVAGGPIVRNALRIENGLTDADVEAREFAPKYVAQARIGGGSSVHEMQVGAADASPAATEHFTWTNGQQTGFLLWRVGSRVNFVLTTDNQYQVTSYVAECASGECNDIFIRAQSGGTGTITISSLTLNGIAVPDVLTIAVGGPARSIHLSGLSLGDGALLFGLAKLEWTPPTPTGSQVNFTISAGHACPTEGFTGGGGAAGTPPLARTDAYSTDEDTPLVVGAAAGLRLNDITFGGALSASIVDMPANGAVSLAADGSFSYTPNANFNGQDMFRYRVSDGSAYSDAALVTISVNPVADVPVAGADTASTNEGVAVTINVLANDSDALGPFSLTSLTQPANGSATMSNGAIVYTPAAGFSGQDRFTYTIAGAEGSATAAVSVTVINVNQAPLALNNSYTMAEDTPLTVAAPGVKANDTDPDAGDTFEAVLVAGPQHGTLVLNASGAFTYTPAANFNGTDSFSYRVRDAGGLESNVATVALTVTAVNDPPVAANDSYVVSEDSVLQINAPGVRDNDVDPDTQSGLLSVSIVTPAQRGSVTLNADGSFLYTPLPNVSGSDTFTYRLSDGSGSSIGTVNIAITDVADPPVAADDAATTSEDTAVTIPVLTNDSDSDTATLTLQSVTQPANGAVQIVQGQVRYTPNPNFNGSETFTYTVTDGTATATANVVVTVTAVNDAPVSVADAYSTARDTALTVPAPGLIANDTDVDAGQTLIPRVVTPAANGTVAMQGGGAFTYTPATNFTGSDSFSYRVNDGVADGNVVTVTITVTSTNQPPAAVNDSYSTSQGTAVTIAAPGVLGNDTDPDEGGTLTATIVQAPPSSAGTLTLNANGSFTFTPADDYTGTTSFTYRARDNANADSNVATVNIEVRSASSSGQVCYDGGGSFPQVRATLSWTTAANGDVTIRTAVTRNYADNTYGINKIGWPGSRTFEDLYKTDMAQIALYDEADTRRMELALDYLSPKSGTPSGYGSTGVSGGGSNADGAMILGSAANIVSYTTAMDRNMNAFGYVTTLSSHPLKTYSPPTNTSYTTNAIFPGWIWDVWYEVTVKGAAFGTQGFGSPRLVNLNASPAKLTITTIRVVNCQ